MAQTEFSNPERKYRIGPTGSFLTGAMPDGTQVLLGLYAPNILAVFFDQSGTLLGPQFRAIQIPRLDADQRIYAVSDPSFRMRLSGAISDWQRDLHLSPKKIDVKKFDIQDLAIRIADRPEYFDEFLNHPEQSGMNIEAQARLRKKVDQWDRDEMFVFFWAKDYWLTRDGDLHST